MATLALHEFHHTLGARFSSLNDAEIVENYGDALAEHTALGEHAGLLDLSFRSRFCLTGADRARFLHCQVTNDVQRLAVGEGCYAALITAKGRIQSDLNIYRLQDELLLDFEPGLTQVISERLEKYVIADDVQVVDVAPHYGLLSVQGHKAASALSGAGITGETPAKAFNLIRITDPALGEIYLMNQPRLGTSGFDLFVPLAGMSAMAERLLAAAKAIGGRFCGWEAFEMARIEAGIPRFGVGMDESNIALEARLENRANSFRKGGYIGQEVISRIKTYGQVAKALRGLRLADDLRSLPVKGDKLFHAGKEVGYVTSALASPALKANVALAYVRKEANELGSQLRLRTKDGESSARIVKTPFNSA